MRTSTETHAVEVSGWDDKAQFFVERAELCWDVSGDKFVILRSPVRDGSMLSIRPILLSGIVGPLLMAHRAELVHDPAPESASADSPKFEIHLVPYRRRASAKAPRNRSLDSFSGVQTP